MENEKREHYELKKRNKGVLTVKTRNIISFIRWYFTYFFILSPIRTLFGALLPPILKYLWHNGNVFHLAQDDHPVYDGCKIPAYEDVPYGDVKLRETVDIIVPSNQRSIVTKDLSILSWLLLVVKSLSQDVIDLLTCYPRYIVYYLHWRFYSIYYNYSPTLLNTKTEKENAIANDIKGKRVVLFIHGGGFCAVGPGIQHHQATALVRRDNAVFCMSYPWAPENPYPSQIISTLRLLRWMRSKFGIESVSIVGESAGGSLACKIAALLCNKDSLQEFARRVENIYKEPDGKDISNWTFPEVKSVTSWYGILDSISYQEKGFLWWGLQWTSDAYRGASPLPSFLLNVPDGSDNEARQTCDFLTISDMASAGFVKKFPPTLLISGISDPLGLVESSRVAAEHLSLICPDIDETVSHQKGTISLFDSHDQQITKTPAYVKTKATALKKALFLHEYDAGHAFIGLNPFVLWFTQGLLHGMNWREYALPATRSTGDFIERFHSV